jgi:mono/diheme cytochrome c family protein/predicted Zn-dependent protease
LNQEDRWVEAVQSAKRKGAAPRQVQREIDLGLVRAGTMRNGAENQLRALIDADASPREVATAFVYGYLRREEPKMAKAWIDALAKESPGDPQVPYLRGVYWRSQGEAARARVEFEHVLARYPGHELARAAVAEMAEEKDQLRQALEQYVEMATQSPACESAKVGMARVLRKQGDVATARSIMAPLVQRGTRESASPNVTLEMGQIALESGNYAVARSCFAEVDREEAKVGEATAAALMPFAADGGEVLAAQLFDQVEAVKYRSRRVDTLKVRLAIDPNDREAARELQSRPPRPARVEQDRSVDAAMSGADLYARYCSACHGANGNGEGRAARHNFPRPRDLRGDAFRLVSTVNGVATLEDLEAVTNRGMPGTAMRAYDMLSAEQQRLLAEEVQRLHREGLRDRIVQELTDDGEEIDADEVREEIELRATPGKVVRPPPIGRADSQAIARGEDLYVELGCYQCHGKQGIGEPDKVLFNARGRPTRPRDLVREPLKGGPEPESIFLRIFLGMPGTDHPACASLTEAQIIDLVQYCRALSREPKRALTNHERSVYQSTRAYVAAFGTAETP